MSNNNYVKSTRNEGVSTIEFATAQSNSLPGYILAQLSETILSEGASDEVKVIVLQSGGDRTYCAGASFEELRAIQNEVEGLKFFMGFANVINAIRKCGKIVIGKIQGKAVGGGVGLASAVDYCVATEFASIRLSELAIGIGPFVIGPVVERKVGLSQFSMLAITPEEWRTAEWAKSYGLYHEVLKDKQELDEYTDRFAKKLCSYNPQALKELKNVFWQGTNHWDELLPQRAAMSGTLVLSEFTKQAIGKI